MRTLAFILLFPALLWAESNPYLQLGAIKPVTLHAHRTTEFSIPIEINSGFHIQANPASQQNLIPTTLVLDAAKGITIEKIVYPTGHAYRLQNSDRDISAYEGKLDIKVFAKATSPKVARELKGKLKFQACNDKNCFFPASVALTIPVKSGK